MFYPTPTYLIVACSHIPCDQYHLIFLPVQQFIAKALYQFGFRYFLVDLSMFDDQSFPDTSGNSDIRLLCLTRSDDHTAQNSNFDV